MPPNEVEMVQAWPVPERSPEAWAPFMDGLFKKIRKERRRRALVRLGAAACFLVALWAGFGLGSGRKEPPLVAEVPTTEAPLFQPDAPAGSQPPLVLVCAR